MTDAVIYAIYIFNYKRNIYVHKITNILSISSAS